MRFPKTWLARFLQATVSFAIIYYLIQLVDWQAVGSLLASGTLLALWPGPLILLLGLMLAAERWRALLAFFGVNLRRSEAFTLYLIGNFYSVLLPGVLGGDVVRIGLCQARTRCAATSVIASVGIERGLGLWGVTLIGALGALAVWLLMPDMFDVATLLISPLLAAAVPLAVFLTLHIAARVRSAVLARGLLAKAMQFISQLSCHVSSLPFTLTLRTLMISTAFQASEILIYIYFGHILQVDVPYFFYIFAIPIVYIATVLPISLGGIGVREGVLVWLLTMVGAPASSAVLLAFLVYLNRVVVGIIGGVAQAAYKT